MNLPHIQDAPELKGKRVIVRVDFDVSIGGNGVLNENEATRVEKSLRTIQFLQDKGARVILISHIGRDPKETLRPVAEYLNKVSGLHVGFVPHCIGDDVVPILGGMKEGRVILLENLRQHEEEKKNDPEFAKALASYGDLFVNDAFAVSHREHASIVGIAKLLPAYVGFQFVDEVIHLSKARTPEHPALLLIGGAKFETKFDLLKEFLPKVDLVFVGGALANNFLKVKGFEVGKSLLDPEVDLSDVVKNLKVHVPIDVITDKEEVKTVEQVTSDEKILDIGPATIEHVEGLLKGVKTVIWNGPMGNYENGFVKGTEAIAKAVAKNKGASFIGGGDTLAATYGLHLEKDITFISTGGGAMLDFLVKGTLPGIEALQK